MVEQNESITHLYRIGHTEIEITAPLSMKSPRNLEKFRIGQAKRTDDEVIHYQVEMTENLDEIKEDLLGKKTGRVIYRDNLTVFQTSGGECRFINFLGMDWHYAVSSQEGVNQYHVWFVPEVAEMLDQDTVYLAAFSLEKQAIKDHSMILHSAYMCYEDTAVLFSAPSETGKSTQAGLWEKYRGTWTVNGDRSLLIREEDGWYANGWPVCGSSEICNNKSYPVRAIVMLSQAKENRISRLKGLEALRKVMEQITINAWNSEFQIQAMDECEEAVVAVHRAYNYLRSTVLFLGEYQLSVKICGIGNSVGDICRRHGLCGCTVCPADGGSVPVYSYQWCTEGCSC